MDRNHCVDLVAEGRCVRRKVRRILRRTAVRLNFIARGDWLTVFLWTLPFILVALLIMFVR